MANWKKILLSGSNAHVAGVTASVLPSVTDNATLLFAGTNGEVQTNSNLTFDTANNTLSGSGITFSGSFSGDGSGLTGVNFTAQQLVNGNGINTFAYNGSSGASVSVKLNALGSGLVLSSDGLAINPGTGLEINGSDELAVNITDLIDGSSLQESGGVIEVNTTLIASASETITFKTGSNNITATTSDTHTEVEGGFSIEIGESPSVTLGLSDTLDGNFTFNDDVTIQGDLTVNGASSNVNFQTTNVNISDPFILVASGSSGTTDGGIVVQTSNTQGAFLFYDAGANAWGVSGNTEALSTTAFDLNAIDNDIATIVTCELTSSANEYDMYGNDPLFGSSGNGRLGHLRITTNPSAKESSLFIFA